MGPPERRVFFALWPPDAAAERLHAAALAAHAACGGKAMRRENLHITLAFLGNVTADRYAAAESVAAAIDAPGFALELDELGWWKHNRILWAGCRAAPAALLGLADTLAARLRATGFVLDERPYAVHATLLRNARCPPPLPTLDVPIAWTATDFALVESVPGPGGSRYTVRRRWPLQSSVSGGEPA